MAEVNIPPIVNDQGNINVHIGEGACIPIIMRDENGVDIDASAIPLFFEAGEFRKELDLDSNNPLGRQLSITQDDLELIEHGEKFRVVDETNLQVPVNRWEGRLFKRGF